MRSFLVWTLLLTAALAADLRTAFSQPKNSLPPLTLEEAVTLALGQNPELKAMQKDIDAAQAKISQARSWDDPMVGVRFYQVPFFGSFDDAADIDYIVSQKFPFPGKKKAASRIAYHDYLHHIELLGGRGRELLREVKASYFSLFSVERTLGVSHEIERNLRGVVQAAQAKLAANQAPATDSILAQTEIAKVLAERQSLIERKKSFQARLNRLMGRPQTEEIRLPSKLAPPRWEAKEDELIEIALLRHSSVKKAEHTIDQKRWGVKAAKKEYFPDLTAQMEYVQRPGADPNAWTGEFMLNVPLIVKKKRKGVQQAQAELASAEYSYAGVKNDVEAQVKETFAKMKAGERMQAVYGGTLLPQTRQAVDTAFSAYAAGTSDFFSLLNSLRGLFEAQMEYWKAYEAYAAATYELEEAVGITREEWAEMKNPPNLPLPKGGDSNSPPLKKGDEGGFKP